MKASDLQTLDSSISFLELALAFKRILSMWQKEVSKMSNMLYYSVQLASFDKKEYLSCQIFTSCIENSHKTYKQEAQPLTEAK